MQIDNATQQCADLKAFVRTRYFYGQRLDVRHFETEQRYVRGKLALLNRLVHGFGVVCGLDVQLSDDQTGVVVLSGLALDRAGREIIAPCRSGPYAIPAATEQTNANGGAGRQDKCCDQHEMAHVCLCFDCCESDPEPVLASGCDAPQTCSPGLIRERFRIEVRTGAAPLVSVDSSIPDLIMNNRLNYGALARHITRECMAVPEDTCIPLANIRRHPPGEKLESTDIDITVRPIVYGNDVLFEMLLSVINEAQARRGGGGKF